MKILYLDCGMGAAGDMLAAALLELLPEAERENFLRQVNGLGLPGVRVERQRAVKCGIVGTHLAVTVDGVEEESLDHHDHGHPHDHGHGQEHEHAHEHYDHEQEHVHEHHHDYEHDHEHGHGHGHQHSGLHDIEHLVQDHLDLPEKVREDVLGVYRVLAEAEGQAHGVPVTEIHFHEVGTADAVADIAMACLLIHRLAPDKIAASPIRTGTGQVRCAHGLLPVPAPAAAYLLRGIPTYGGEIPRELCTPTGAALLRYFVTEFGPQPVMEVSAIGYGCGKKDFSSAANCLRAMLGEAGEQAEAIVELSCNVDDMTGEEIGFAMDRLFTAGALDVFTVPVGMKKSRPGVWIHVLCAREDRERMAGLLFRHTTTIGLRESLVNRRVLRRRVETVDAPWGPVRRKVSEGYGVRRAKAEYEDLAAAAREQGISLREAEETMRNGG